MDSRQIGRDQAGDAAVDRSFDHANAGGVMAPVHPGVLGHDDQNVGIVGEEGPTQLLGWRRNGDAEHARILVGIFANIILRFIIHDIYVVYIPGRLMNTTTNAIHSTSGSAAAASPSRIPITIAVGDGIGPEIAAATRLVLAAAAAPLEFHEVTVGERAYLGGVSSGIPDDAWQAIRTTGVLLKGPITTPQGGGYKSVNVTLRKVLGLFANVRPCASHACVPRSRPGIDLVVVRENEEDLYAGIEHRQTPETYQCLKLVTRSGCERIVRYAFAYALANGRRRVTCMTKDNIMKLTDGLFHRVFDQVAAEHPGIVADHQIIDIGAARVATRPEHYDVIVTMNLYGDILSDIAAEVAGSVGMGGSANIGARAAMFEAVHGSAPDLAGKGVANPSGMLQSAVQMLVHLGLPHPAECIHNAWLRTLEDGVLTADLTSSGAVSTSAFAEAVAARLGQLPQTRAPVAYGASLRIALPDIPPLPAEVREQVGIDIFLHHVGQPHDLATSLLGVVGAGFDMTMITNRGVKVWPDGHPETICTDHWRCRFMSTGMVAVPFAQLLALIGRLDAAGFDVIKTEGLFYFAGKPGYSAGQGA